jgi:hypothetical protein
MTIKRLPGLRNHMQRVDLVQLDDNPRPVLGSGYPQHDEMDRCSHVQQSWDHRAPSPRSPRLASIAEPLEQRTQTILYYQVGPEVRRRLNGTGHLASSRQQNPAVEDVAEPPPDIPES